MELEILKYYNRRDNTIAGPLIKTETGKWWDIVREELYFNDGFKTDYQLECDADIISENNKYRNRNYIIQNTKHLQRNGKLTEGELKYHDTIDNLTLFIDETSKLIYNQFGWLYNNNVKSENDLTLNNQEHQELIENIIQYIDKHEFLNFDDYDENNLCNCDGCKESRNILKSGKDTELVSDIKSLYNECMYYIDLPPLPNFYYIPNNIQINYLDLFSEILEIFNIEFLKNFINKKKIPRVNSINKNTNNPNQQQKVKKLKIHSDLWSEFLKINSEFFDNKNIIIDMDYKLFKKYKKSQLNMYLDILSKMLITVPKTENVMVLKFTPKMIDYKTLKDNTYFSDNNKPINDIKILKPEFVYSVKYENGIIVSITPIAER